MHRASPVTAVPGYGMMLMGATALVAAYYASIQTQPSLWIRAWAAEAILAAAIGAVAMGGRRATPESLGHGPARKFLLGLAPPLVLGLVLTAGAVGIGPGPRHSAGRLDGLVWHWGDQLRYVFGTVVR